MTILHVAPIVAGVATGPASSVPLQMITERRLGHRVAFLQSYPGPPPALPEGVIRLPWRPMHLGWLGPFRAEALFARTGLRPAVVHFHAVYLPMHATIARAVRRLGIPTVSSPRGGLMPMSLATRAWKKRLGDVVFFDAFSRGLVLHRALNEAERVACLARYPGVPARVVGNPIDVDAVPYLPPPRLRAGSPVLGYLGRLDVYTKGLDLLLEALRRALDRGLAPSTRLWLAGPDHRQGAARLRRVIGALDLADHVALAGPLGRPAASRFLETIDIFVHPSRHEGLPMGVLEAMAAGRAVLVTPETNVGAVIERHAAGWVAPGCADGLAAALVTATAEPEQIVARGRAGRQAVRQEFSMEAVGAQLDAAYAEATRREGRRAA
jgi:glycosyltransferase involved in cell wall biosynthesis